MIASGASPDSFVRLKFECFYQQTTRGLCVRPALDAIASTGVPIQDYQPESSVAFSPLRKVTEYLWTLS
jgi:hypothetical protein